MKPLTLAGLAALSLASASTVSAQTSAPVAIFANDANLPAGSKVISMSSGHSTISGRIHCNSDIDVSGTANYFQNGVVEYVTGIHPTPAFSGKVTLQNCPVVQTSVQPLPVTYQQSDFAPGGTEAVAAQAAGQYYHILGDTHLTAFMTNGVLRTGLYYIEGSLNLSQGALVGEVTIVATGTIIISGPGENWRPYTRCLLAFSTKSLPYNNPAINISSGSSRWSGVLFAPNGGVEISGTGDTVTGGALIGLGVELTGSSLNLTGIDFNTCAGTPTNHPPSVNAGPDQALSLHTNTVFVTMQGSAADDGLPAGGRLETLWSLLSGPGPVTFADPTLTNTVVSFNTPGTYVFRLTADDTALANTDDVTITFDRPDNPPVAYGQSLTNLEETTLAIVLAGSDPDGDPVTFSIATQPSFGTLSGAAPNLSYTPKPGYVGSDSFTFKVSDGFLESAGATVTITNLPVNHAPLAETQSLTTPKATPIQFTLTGSDLDGDRLTFTITSSPTNGTLTGASPTFTYTPSSNYFGRDALTFKASDGITSSAPALVSITVTPIDSPPQVNAGPDQTISLPQNTAQLAGTVAYDDFPETVDTLQWSQVSGPGAATFSEPTNPITTVTFSQAGVYVLQLFASDSFMSGSNSVRVTVNAPPNVSAGSAQTNTLPGIITLNGYVTDDGLPSNGVLSILWTNAGGTGTVVFADPTATNTTAAFSRGGLYTLRLTATDGAAGAFRDVTVLVNEAPVVDAGSDQTITNLQVSLTGTLFDDGWPLNVLTSRWTVVSGPGEVNFADPAVPVTTATFSKTGFYTLRLTAGDSLASSFREVTIGVDAAPVVDPGTNQTINFPASASLAATVTDDGLPPGAALTTSWTALSGPGTVTFSARSALATTATFSSPGVYVLRLTANDSLLATAASLTVVVNQAPTVSAAAPALVNLPDVAQLTGTVTDDGLPAGSTLISVWTKLSGPGPATFGDPTAPVTTAAFSQSGTYTLQLSASDGISTNSATVTVVANRIPEAHPQSVTTDEGTPLPILLSGTDADGDPLTFKVTSQPAHGSLSGTAPSLSYTSATNYTGTDSFAFVANDGWGDSAPATISIVVRAAGNQPPVVDAGPDRLVPLGAGVELKGSVSDDGRPAGSVLTVWWELVSGPFTDFLMDNTNAAATRLYLFMQGTYVFRLNASDSVLTASDDVTITVTNQLPANANHAPTADLGLPRVLYWPSNQLDLTGVVSDDGLPAGQPLKLIWSACYSDGGTAWLTGTNGLNPTVLFSQPGQYSICLDVSDSDLVGSAYVDILVEPEGSTYVPPVVDAGPDQTLIWPDNQAILVLPPASAAWSFWSEISGPAQVSFMASWGPNGMISNWAVCPMPGVYTLRLTVSDGYFEAADDMVVTVLKTNNVPVVADQWILVQQDSSTNITLAASDRDGDPLTYTIVSMPTNGTLSGVPPLVTYTPHSNFFGGDSFTYRANDGQVDSALATVSLTVNPPNNHVPSAYGGSLWTYENSAVKLYLQGQDADGDPLRSRIVRSPAHGKVIGEMDPYPPRTYYIPDGGFYGTDTLTYVVNDGKVDSPAVTLSIDVYVTYGVPLLTISSPLDGAQFSSGQTIPIHLDLSDEQHAVTSITLYADGVQLANLTQPPFNFAWSNAALGTHQLTAATMDSWGRSYTALPVSLSVVPPVSLASVDAGPDQLLVLPTTAHLAATVKIPANQTNTTTNALWKTLSGPAEAAFANASALTTDAAFSQPGNYVLSLEVTTDLGRLTDTLQVEVLAPDVNPLNTVRSSRGQDFWLTFLNNYSDGGPLSLMVSSEHDASGEVQFYDSACQCWRSTLFTVKANSSTMVPMRLTQDSQYDVSDTVVHNGIHLTASADVSVYAVNARGQTGDGSLTLPRGMLGTNYLVLTYLNAYAPGAWPYYTAPGTQFGIVATEDNTSVQIIPSVTTGSRQAGVPFTVVLQKGDTYRLINTTTLYGDMSGSSIVSDKPVAVLAGHSADYVPSGYQYADNLVEQLPPVEMWGRQFFTMPLAGRLRGDTLRVIASADATTVSINGRVARTLRRGEVWEHLQSEPACIVADKPALVAQYANGNQFDNQNGDPFMCVVPATTQLGSSYVVATPLIYDSWLKGDLDLFWYGDFVNLVAPSAATNSLNIDGLPASDVSWTSIGTSGFVGAQIPVTAGAHAFSAQVPFSLILYGWGSYIGYGYPAGLSWNKLEPGTSLTLQQTTPFAPVGGQKTVIAGATTSDGQPLSDLEVLFEVTGANSVSTRLRTGPFGEAIFTYRGDQAGDDLITASLLQTQQRLTNTWLAAGGLPPVVDAGPDQTITFGQSLSLQGTVTNIAQPTNPPNVSWRTLNGPVAARFAVPSDPATPVYLDLPGVYRLELVANNSIFEARDTVTITVSPTNFLPTITLNDPGSGRYRAGRSVGLYGNAYDLDGWIVRIELYDGDTKVAETPLTDTYDQYQFDWIIPSPGFHQVHTVAVDDQGGRTSSPVYTIDAREPQLTLTQPAPAALVGTEKTVVARMTDDTGAPWPYEWAYFTVTGANPTSGYVFPYQPTGEAVFAYSGINPGDDVIEFYVYGYSSRAYVTNTWLLESTNQPPTVSATAAGILYLNKPVSLLGVATDDGLPSNSLTYSWRVLSGYGNVRIDNPATNNTVAYFDTATSYQLEFTASDGLFSSRALVSVTISDNLAPVVSLTVSTNEVGLGKSFTVYAHVWDEDDDNVTVSFFDTGVYLSSGYWSKANSNQLVAATYVITSKGLSILTATATDWRGLASQSAPVYVFGGSRPHLAWLTPTANQVVAQGQPLSLTSQATDSDGTVTNVSYYLQDGTNWTLIGQGAGAQFACAWTPANVGPAVLMARAWDNDGLFSEDQLTQVLVTPPLPSITLTMPAANDLLNLGAPVPVALTATDPANLLTNFEFRVDNTILASGPAAFIVWTPSQLGAHTLQAFGDDSYGRRVVSDPVPVTVANLIPPVVAITTPTNTSHYAPGADVFVLAEAADVDGVVTSVSLVLDGDPVATSTNAFIEQTLTNLAGWHSVSAQAEDDTRMSAASQEVQFFVQRSEDGTLPVPASLTAAGVSATEIQLAWSPLPTNDPPFQLIVERWDPLASVWNEVEQLSLTDNTFTDSGLNPETLYRYRVAAVDQTGRRSTYSSEAQAATRTVVPNYAVIDISDAVKTAWTSQRPISNPMTNAGFNNFDQRRTLTLGGNYAKATLGTNASAVILAAARFKERWPNIQLDFDPALLTPQSIMPRSGFLTGPGGSGVTVSDATAQMFPPNDPYRAVKAFLEEYQAIFGHGPEALDAAAVRRDYVTALSGARTVVWQQQVAGVPVLGGLLIGHLTQAGELAALSSEFIPRPEQVADPAMVALLQSGEDLPLSGSSSLVAAVSNIGELFSDSDVVLNGAAQGPTRKQSFTAATGIKGEAYAELTWFPAQRTQLRLCWQVIFTSRYHNEMYLALVAADTGDILLRRDLTTTIDEATYRVFTGNSPAPMSPGWPNPNAGQAPFVDRALVTLSAADTNASPLGWISDGVNETRGNNADASLDRNDDDLPDSHPVGNPSRVFDYPLDLASGPANYGDAATVQLFFWNNWMHDALYGLGFTEAAGNFQDDNLGRGGLGGDAVMAQAQDGLSLNDRNHVNNANMSTPPDGYAPRMQMYIFDGASPGRDGALDAGIVLHEYTHGLSTRLIGGGAGIDALATAGMGEGWSDFYSLALLADPAADVDATYPVGSYVTYHAFGTTFDQNYYFGIRRYPYCTDTNKNPLTFKDIDPWASTPHADVSRSPLSGAFRADMASEVHNQGEVWCTMLWEMRANLVKKHGFEQGNALALQLVTDGLRLSPANPNFVQARDAILLADRISTQGDNAADISAAFAKRGLGFSAKAPDSRTTTGVHESFDLQPALSAERLEVQGGNGNGTIEAGEDNNLVLYVRNHGQADASNVSATLSSTTPGVILVQPTSAYPDIPRNDVRVNSTAYQIRTTADFVEGTSIDLVLQASAGPISATAYLRIYTGVPNPDILFDNISNFGEATAATAATRDLTPYDLQNLEPLWMADDASCLLKAAENSYVLWRPDGTTPWAMTYPGFLAHRLTRSGLVVGQIQLPNTVDVLGDQIQHTVGVKWVPGQAAPINVTSNDIGYSFPKDAAIQRWVGTAYNLTNRDDVTFITNMPVLWPTLHSLWDLNAQGNAAGSASVYILPDDLRRDGVIDTNDVMFGIGNRILFGPAGTMNWDTVTERGYSSGLGSNADTALDYNALITTAAVFPAQLSWQWLGPLNFKPEGSASAIATLINDAGMVAGYGGIKTGNQQVDDLTPTHAFRWRQQSGEFAQGAPLLSGNATPVLTDLGVLPGGLYSQPYAMNRAGQLVGYSDFDTFSGGAVNPNPYNFHGVYWADNDNAPEDLPTFGPVAGALNGYSYAFDINDQTEIVGTSWRPARSNYTATSAGVIWQLDHKFWAAQPEWQITDLNERLTGPVFPTANSSINYLVTSGVGVNNDDFILAKTHATGSITNQSAPGNITIRIVEEDRAVLLVPVETRSRDRLLTGALHFPNANSGYGVRLINESSGEILADVSDLGDASQVFATEEAMMEAPERSAKGAFYRDPQNPGVVRFTVFSKKLGSVKMQLLKQGQELLTLRYQLISDPEFRDFLVFADERIDTIEMPAYTLDSHTPSQEVDGIILPGICNYSGVQALDLPLLEPQPLDEANTAFRAGVGISKNYGVEPGTQDADADKALELTHPELVAKSCEALVAAAGRETLVTTTGVATGAWDGAKDDVIGAVDGWRAVWGLFKDPIGRCKQLRDIGKALVSIKKEQIFAAAKNMWTHFKSKAEKDTDWVYAGQPERDPEAVRYYTIGYGGGYAGEQVLSGMAVGGITKFGSVGKLLSVAAKGPFDLGNVLAGSKKLKGAFSKFFSQHADCEGAVRALNKTGDAVKCKYIGGPFKNMTPGEVLEQALDDLQGSPEALMKQILESENLAFKRLAKDPAWTEQAARYLVRTADLTGDLATQGERITENAMHGFVEAFDLVATTGRNGDDRYQLLLRILKDNAQDQQTTIVKALEDLAAAPKGTFAWNLPPTVRGVAIEARLASTEYKTWNNVGQLNGGYFELFDFNKGGTWVSLKTIDPTSATAMSRAKGYVDKLGQAVAPNPSLTIKLDLRVPPSYVGELDDLVSYAAAKGVKVDIKTYP